MTQMNLSSNRNRLTDTETCDCQGVGAGEGWIGSLGLADANYYIKNGWMTKSYTKNCIQCAGINHNRKENKRECIYIHITELLCCTAEINTL